ncbi:hypothetical protein K457DRAFT_131377 [Linnemannia elongata AG-77]|uniref:Uncharacterized protein n=1 Tax=Linnemannia elongata AG-77 TaxID=1314771 RepID=A0A197JB19_9FUNG|nr:hypothetical protein K457DRAFT_131377 [Linnemannia elongata AG-77]
MSILGSFNTRITPKIFFLSSTLARLRIVHAVAPTDTFDLSAGVNILETVLAAVPLMGLIGSSRAREKWTASCASGSGALLLPMASYSDCRALLQPLEGDPHVAAHINMGSTFDVSQKAAVASILQEVRGMAIAGVEEPPTPQGRRQKLYIAEVRHQEAQVEGRIITGLQALAMIAISITGSFGTSSRSVIYLWTYVLAALVTTCAAISCYPNISKTQPERSRTKAYVVTPNWNSDELFMLIGDGDELAAILNRPALQDRIGRVATVAVSISCFFVAVASALILGQPELRTNLSCFYWNEAPGWWNKGLPDTPRSHRWAQAVEAACKGILTLPALPVDDFADLKSARDILEATLKAGFSPVTSDAGAGLKNFMEAS